MGGDAGGAGQEGVGGVEGGRKGAGLGRRKGGGAHVLHGKEDRIVVSKLGTLQRKSIHAMLYISFL